MPAPQSGAHQTQGADGSPRFSLKNCPERVDKRAIRYKGGVRFSRRHRPLMKLLYTLKHIAYTADSRYFCRATLVEGIMKDTNLIVRCHFIDKKALSKYMMQKIYSGTPKIVKWWIIYIPSIKNHTGVHSWN